MCVPAQTVREHGRDRLPGMRYVPENPLVVQSDRTLLLETMGPHFASVRDALARFAELVKSPEYVHTYRLTPLSLWNAAAAGVSLQEVTGALEKWAKYDVPPGVPVWIGETMGRWGRLELLAGEEHLILQANEPSLMAEIRGTRGVRELLGAKLDPLRNTVATGNRGLLKQSLIAVGHPVLDRAGFVDGGRLDVELALESEDGEPWGLRTYQEQAVDAFLGAGNSRGEGGSGVIVLPCGAGKTIVGLSALARLGMKTLILCTNVTALRQWRDEIVARTSLTAEEVGEYSGQTKEIKPVTLSTYQMLTHRRSKSDAFVHFGLFDEEDWGLVIYDEVHLLPAPVFRTVAQLQARRRLGLTATLVREDGRQSDVFALIGPKRFDVPWRDLERQGWIATAKCTEIRVDLEGGDRMDYAVAADREKYRLASTNRRKLEVVQSLLERHPGERTLVIGMYLDQLGIIAKHWGVPIITGKTRQSERDRLFARFRNGEDPVLVLSRVGNFSVDLPDASVAIQVSGTWGSRQEEAQRLGRVLRPKKDGNMAYFYTVVTRDSTEQDFAERRQLFLAEQGYSYTIETWEG